MARSFIHTLTISFIVIVIFPAFNICADPLGTDCPEDAVFGQPPHLPEDLSSSQTSDEDASWSPGIIHDNFAGIDNVAGIHFWGINAYVDYGYFACMENPMTFEICFYIDSLNQPGRQVACYTQQVEGTPTGLIYYDEFELYEYSANLPTVQLSEGWVSIEGQGGSTSCWFFWLSSREGMDSISAKYGGDNTYYSNDFAFCLFE